jgi:hypothetical protein
MDRDRRSRLLRPRPRARAAGAVTFCLAFTGIPSSSDAQTPADDVAAQVRAQGYQCDRPISAERDVGLSQPDSPVWILKCQNTSYRVRLHPDMAAGITQLAPDTH